ncbi:MAG: GT4 family glycosyltransferase PelF [Deltaproteobacteria bacterium]|nr:GT4 family glycosyltransferase PelF [Deltaproteobacteria bacterium]
MKTDGVVGGVSTWVHDLLSSMKDVSFSLMHIGVSKDIGETPRYELPKNVLEFRQVHLMDTVPWKALRIRPRRASWRDLDETISELVAGEPLSLDRLLERFSPGRSDALTPYDVFHGREFWDILVRLYRDHLPDFSFIDFFWTVRFMALPLFRIMYADIPDAALYHATCTGYAGLLGAIATTRTRAPMIITEHGIYTNERMIEITQAQWIYREKPHSPVPTKQLGALQALWMNKFDVLSRVAYERAARIYTLYEGNRVMQVQGGAPPDKCLLIPNGIDIERFDEMYARRDTDGPKGPPRIAMVGRVAPIKDVKTFIRAARMVAEVIPDARFYVLGTPDEDESYFEECERLVRVLSLNRCFEFTGPVKMAEWYPQLSAVVLTSISEAQPFVLLEAMRAGVPVVATNVGACAELVLGTDGDDEKIGVAARSRTSGRPARPRTRSSGW